MAKLHHQQRCCASRDDSRRRLLNRLGIFEVSPLKPLGVKRPPSASLTVDGRPMRSCSNASAASLLGRSERMQTTLNDSASSPFESPLDRRSPTQSTDSASFDSSGVHFNETVSVIEIPSRHQYSDRIKKFMWSTKFEITENAERNIIEFEHEGFDWRNVVLDDDMYIDTVNGTLIHPCHFLDPTSMDDDDDYTNGKDEFLPLARSEPIM